MKILLVSPYFIDSYTNNLSMGSAVKLSVQLSKLHEVIVLTSGRKTSQEQLNQNLSVTSVSGVLIPDPVNYMISFQILSKFVQLTKSFHPDVIIVSKYMFFSSFVIPIARMMKLPVITITDTYPGINWFPPSALASAIMWLYARLIGLPLLWLSSQVVLLHPGLEPIAKQFHINYVTIPNGVEPEAFQILPPPKDIHKPIGEFWIGFVGRPDMVKGYNLMLKIAQALPEFKFIFVGGDFKPHTVNNRLYLGFRPALPFFQLFDAYCLPSSSEGLPNVVMEAMSQGVPVIANPVGGVNSLITHNKTGFLVNSNSPKDYIKYINLLYSNPKLSRKIGTAAREKIYSDYNWDKILPRYQNLIKSVCTR